MKEKFSSQGPCNTCNKGQTTECKYLAFDSKLKRDCCFSPTGFCVGNSNSLFSENSVTKTPE